MVLRFVGPAMVIFGLLWTIPAWGSASRPCTSFGPPEYSCAASQAGMVRAVAAIAVGALLTVASWVLAAVDERRRSSDEAGPT